MTTKASEYSARMVQKYKERHDDAFYIGVETVPECTKLCSLCGNMLHVTEFYRNPGLCSGFSGPCMECSKIDAREKKLLRRYKLSVSEYDELLRVQNSSCAICGIAFENTTPFVDHDHNTGNVRGLLCNTCNTGIGMLGDTPDLLYKAIVYLERV